MKKIIKALIVIAAVLLALISISYLYTNSIIKNNDYNRAPQWINTGIWKIRDVFFPCDTETKLIRAIVYNEPSLLENEIDEEISMPLLTGYSGIDVIYNLKKYGYDVKVGYSSTGNYDENKVVLQEPSAGIIIKPGDTIEVVLEDAIGNSRTNNQTSGGWGPFVVVQGADVFYYDFENKQIIKTDYDCIKKEIIYSGEAEQLAAQGSCLFFYSYEKNGICKLNIQSNQIEKVYKGSFGQYTLCDNYIYYIDIDDHLYLKRIDMKTEEEELLIENLVTYFQIENDVIYYFCNPRENSDLELGIQKINSVNSEEISEEVINGEMVYNFLVKDEFIYYIKEYERAKSKLIKVNIDTNRQQIIYIGIIDYVIEDEFLLIRYAGGIKDNRSLKGLFGVKTNKMYYDFYVVGKKVFLRTINDEWQVFDGRSIYKLD